MQWSEIKAVKEKMSQLDERMQALEQKEVEVTSLMGALALKERELDVRMEELKSSHERLGRLVVRTVQGFLQQTQELSVIKFLLSAIIFGAGRTPESGGTDEPDVPPGGPGSGGPPSPSTSLVSRWLDSALGSPPTPPSSPGPSTPFTEVSAGEGDTFRTAVSSFHEVQAIEAEGDRGVFGDRGDAGYDGGSEDSWGGVGDVRDNGASQFVRLRELRPMVVSRAGV